MTVKRINLALQGGGAHGAFTWGVLDRLLEDDKIEIAAVSGTSAGALNAAALKAGLVQDGKGDDRQAAKDNLDWLWGQVAGIVDMRFATWFAPFAPSNAFMETAAELSPAFAFADTASRLVSPYAYGVFYANPLEGIVKRFAYDKVCDDVGPALFICATNVRSGKIRVFNTHEVTSDVILASACLPSIFKAIEFTDPKTGKTEAFWDGGYTGNPALFPMFEPEFPQDIVIVNINPLYRDELPKNPADIQNRINEISFNSSLLRELRAIHFVRDLIDEGRIQRGEMEEVLIHMIADDDLMTDLSVATKLVPNAVLLARLKEAGRNAADRFLTDHRAALNDHSTVNLEDMFG